MKLLTGKHWFFIIVECLFLTFSWCFFLFLLGKLLVETNFPSYSINQWYGVIGMLWIIGYTLRRINNFKEWSDTNEKGLKRN